MKIKLEPGYSLVDGVAPIVQRDHFVRGGVLREKVETLVLCEKNREGRPVREYKVATVEEKDCDCPGMQEQLRGG